jgi:hypothetical protein
MNYLLRGIDRDHSPEFWKHIKIYSIESGVSIRELILTLLYKHIYCKKIYRMNKSK